MKTDKQISNAYSRAANLAWNATQGSQIIGFAATSEQMSRERGSAQCAAGFAASALAKLENSDLEGFHTMMRLAGQFAADADKAYYDRTHPVQK